FSGVVGGQRQARTRDVRAVVPQREDRARGPDPCGPQAADEVQDRQARGRRSVMSAGTKAPELRELGNEELLAKLREAKEELFNLRFQAATGQLENHGRLKAVRKDIARIYTLMRERELGIETVENA